MEQSTVRLIKKYAMLAALSPLRLAKIKKNRLLVINGLNFAYAGNPKAVVDYLLSHFPQGTFEIVFPYKDPAHKPFLEKMGLRAVKMDSPEYYYYALTARGIVANAGGYSYLPLKKEQFVINTWHGGGAYKRLGLDVCKHTKAFLKDIALQKKKTTVFLSSSKAITRIFKTAFLLSPGQIVETGMPRNDVLVKGDEEKAARVRERLGLKQGEKLVMYAPTFRVKGGNQLSETVIGEYALDQERLLRALEKRFGASWRFAYRLHPHIAQRALGQFPGALNLSSYPDMQELLLVCDVLINDFSSSMWDFSLSRPPKPCFLFAADKAEYEKSTNWYMPLSALPFSFSETNEALEHAIETFDEETYARAVQNHLDLLGCMEDGSACRRTAEMIVELCGVGDEAKV